MLRPIRPALSSIEAPTQGEPFVAVPAPSSSSVEVDPEWLQTQGIVRRRQRSRLQGETRAKLLTALSAWFTLARMETSGTTFEEFIEIATSDDPVSLMRAKVIWGDLATRLTTAATQAVGKWPEAMLAPEVRAFIEALIATPPEAP